jgi:hypothetical protein
MVFTGPCMSDYELGAVISTLIAVLIFGFGVLAMNEKDFGKKPKASDKEKVYGL